jgi:hypothetical protein
MARLGHSDDEAHAIDTYLTAEALFERGDNRRASAELRALLDTEMSPALREVAERLMQRVRPDRVALIFLGVCVLGLVLIWVLAIRAS